MQITVRCQQITFSFSRLLLWGPFHCTMAFPISSRNISPLLKLFHDTSTCTRSDGELPGCRTSFKCREQRGPWMPHNHRTPNTYNNRYDKRTIICLGGSADTICSSAVWRLRSFQGEGLSWHYQSLAQACIFCSPYLWCRDVFPPFDMKQSQDVVGVSVHVVKTRGYSTLLVAVDGSKTKVQVR